MADEQQSSSPRYKIKLIAIRGEEFDDVIYCVCVKAPFIKKASFWNLKINVSSLWAMQLFNDLSKQVKVKVELKITEIKHEGEFNSLEDGRIIHHKPYMCINATNAMGGYKINMSDQNSEINIILVDHILYDMSIKNSFNRKLSEITAFKALEEYEKCLKTQYGEQTFYNNYINIVDDQKSTYQYEELLMVAKNDLEVTDILIYSKKILQHISFYFFDDFCLDKQNQNHIVSHFINLSNIKKFTPFDISKYFDTLYSTTILKEVPVNDMFRVLTQGYDSFIFKTKFMFDKLEPQSIKTLFSPNVSNIDLEESYKINTQRESTIVKPEINFQRSLGRQKCMSIYVPDKKDLAKERLDNYQDFIDTKVKQLILIQSNDCYCDWIQFGRSYNLDLTKPEEFRFTPIMIANIFYKDGSERSTKHVGKSLMLEYYSDTTDLCSTCKFFYSNTCTLHYIFRDDSSNCYDYTPIS